jgi:hypothetical protein
VHQSTTKRDVVLTHAVEHLTNLEVEYVLLLLRAALRTVQGSLGGSKSSSGSRGIFSVLWMLT